MIKSSVILFLYFIEKLDGLEKEQEAGKSASNEHNREHGLNIYKVIKKACSNDQQVDGQ